MHPLKHPLLHSPLAALASLVLQSCLIGGVSLVFPKDTSPTLESCTGEQCPATVDDPGAGTANPRTLDVDRERSFLTLDRESIPADDAEALHVTVNLRDVTGSSVEGAVVTLSAGGKQNSITPAAAIASDSKGQAVFTLRSKLAEEKTVTVALEGSDSALFVATVRFTQAIADPATSTVTLSLETAIKADGLDFTAATVVAKTAAGGIAYGAPVTIAADDDATFATSPTVGFDGNAIAQVRSRTSGTKQLSIKVGDVTLAVKPLVTFVTVAIFQSAISVTIASNVAVADLADGIEIDVVVPTVTGGVTRDHAVAIDVSGSGNLLVPIGTADEPSSRHVLVTSAKAEQKTITVTVPDAPALAPVIVSVAFVAGPAVAAQSTFTLGPPRLSPAMTASGQVTLKDKFANFCPGATVMFSGTSGLIPAGTSANTDALGQVNVSATLTATGPQTMTVQLQSGDALAVTLDVVAPFFERARPHDSASIPALDPSNPARWFVASGERVFETTDSGASFHPVSMTGVPPSTIVALAAHPSAPAKLFLRTYNSTVGTRTFSGNGGDWTELGPEYGAPVDFADRAALVFARADAISLPSHVSRCLSGNATSAAVTLRRTDGASTAAIPWSTDFGPGRYALSWKLNFADDPSATAPGSFYMAWEAVTARCAIEPTQLHSGAVYFAAGVPAAFNNARDVLGRDPGRSGCIFYRIDDLQIGRECLDGAVAAPVTVPPEAQGYGAVRARADGALFTVGPTKLFRHAAGAWQEVGAVAADPASPFSIHPASAPLAFLGQYQLQGATLSRATLSVPNNSVLGMSVENGAWSMVARDGSSAFRFSFPASPSAGWTFGGLLSRLALVEAVPSPANDGVYFARSATGVFDINATADTPVTTDTAAQAIGTPVRVFSQPLPASVRYLSTNAGVYARGAAGGWTKIAALGNASVLAVDPTDGAVFAASTSTDTIWRSTLGGSVAVNVPNLGLAVRFFVDPRSSAVYLLGDSCKLFVKASGSPSWTKLGEGICDLSGVDFNVTPSTTLRIYFRATSAFGVNDSSQLYVATVASAAPVTPHPCGGEVAAAMTPNDVVVPDPSDPLHLYLYRPSLGAAGFFESISGCR
ncbi:MAG: Ig-like domain-containing protein [Deltaproteobacteria bacterium]|nr:Ig-like domain-containing protein [Deltaproteobacteria bacterium]